MITESIDRMSDTEAPTNPFPGLRPFEFDESHLYFGRDGQSEQLLRKLSSTRFVAVVGTSGSGKSSLVRAGLLPALYGGLMTSAGSNWRVALMRPGNDPVGNLARALNVAEVFGSEIEENAELQTTITEVTLRRGSLGLVEAVRQNRMAKHENLLVIADQFEEIFRYAEVAGDERYQNEAAAFVKLLLEAARQREVNIYVVLTLRSDYLGDCSLFWDLPEAINEGQYLIPRLTREQRREAITGPVAVGGAEITPRLVNRLLNEMGDNPDQLPILQHALMRTWDKWKEVGREREPIDLSHYEATGGMSEALSRHADEAYFELPGERSREIAERLFKSLTEKGKDNRETRRPTELSELAVISEATEQECIAVIEPFRREGRSFLMPPAAVRLKADTLIDISHESLIRNWQRLNEWVDEEARSVRIYQRLAETAALHEKGEAGLWHDPDLQLALEWRKESKPNQAWARRYHPDFKRAMSFLEASCEAREKDAAEKESQRKKELRRTRLIAAILLIAFIVSLASAVYAFRQQKAANSAREKSEAEEKKNSHLLYAANINLAQQSYEDKEILRAQDLLYAHWDDRDEIGFEWYYLWRRYHRHLISFKGHEDAVTSVALSPDGKTLVTGSNDSTAKLWDTATGKELATLKGHQKSITSVALSPDGVMLATGSEDKTVRLWEVASGKELTTLKEHIEAISSLAFSPDGKMLAVGSYDQIAIWDVASRKELTTLKASKSPVTAVAFSPDGRTLATSIGYNSILLWDIASYQKIAWFIESTGGITCVAFSPDGKTVVTGSFDGAARLWDVASGKVLKPFEGHTGTVNAVAFSPDGKILATGSLDNSIKLWDTASHQEMTTLKGHTDSVVAVAFARDGKTLVTGSSDRTAKLWPTTSIDQLMTLEGHQDSVFALAFSPDSKTLASSSRDGNVKLWDTTGTRKELKSFTGHSEFINAVAFSPDGKIFATASSDNTIKLWDTTSWQELATLKGHTGNVVALAFSPDGRTLATGSYDDPVKLWDIDSRQQLATLTSIAQALAFSPDGSALATGSKDKTITLWDVETRGVRRTFNGHTEAVTSVAFSPDGRTLATGSEDKTVRLWDVASGKELTRPLKGHVRPISSVAFSPDGRTLATASHDKSVKLWSTTSYQELVSLKGHSDGVSAVAFSPDGKILATGSFDRFVKLWHAARDEDVIAQRGRTEQ
jgi:WD40 repeat protein/energy-coupling factor transporter ATP-binding protein EcfA2